MPNDNHKYGLPPVEQRPNQPINKITFRIDTAPALTLAEAQRLKEDFETAVAELLDIFETRSRLKVQSISIVRPQLHGWRSDISTEVRL